MNPHRDNIAVDVDDPGNDLGGFGQRSDSTAWKTLLRPGGITHMELVEDENEGADLKVSSEKMAEVHGNRTHLTPCSRRHTGFEVQESHQCPIHFREACG